MGKTFKILSIDGGGIKGLYTSELLAKLEDTFNARITDCFDMICGTSTGGLIALAASLGKPMSEVVDFYKKYGASIFNQKGKRTKLGYGSLIFKQTLFNSKYNGKALKKALSDVFGDTKISESKNFLCIPSYNIISGTPRVFKKDYDDLDQDDRKTYVDVALATSAAPTYFPVKHLDHDFYIDGGVWANNPILVGLSEYLYKFSRLEQFSGVDILSVESCEVPKNEAPKRLNRSFLSWNDTLFDIYSHGQSEFALFLLKMLKNQLKFDLNYYRMANNCVISSEQAKLISMDNASHEAQELLLGYADHTARNEKKKDEVRRFFTTKKSLTPSEYPK